MRRIGFFVRISNWLLLFLVVFTGCKMEKSPLGIPDGMKAKDSLTQLDKNIAAEDTEDKESTEPIAEDKKKKEVIPPQWKEIVTDSTGILLDIKYAGTDNFTKKKIYPCGRCFVRPEVAEKLLLIQKDLKERYGFGLKLFDCYRPAPAQQRLWDAVPDPDYVTPPAKGSMHSKGLAVDLTIVDKNGNDLNMGTPYDFFGREAHHDYEDFAADIQKNRVLIKKVMELHGFNSIRTEWWHYSLTKKSYPLSDWEWQCD